MTRYISLRGARQNNLKNINIDFPRNKFIVITGVSGCGKSSLAFDTVFAEGQRRYMESLSAYARQFMEKMDKPDIDSISGIPPAVAIEQKDPPKSSRSTVGTITEIQDYLRLLYGKIGKTFCPKCNKVVEKEGPHKVLEKILSFPEGTKVLILFSSHLEQSISLKEQLELLKSRGYTRLLTKKGLLKIDDIPSDFSPSGEVTILLDRVKATVSSKSRIINSIETAFREGKGNMEIETEEGERLKFNRFFNCSSCREKFKEPSPLLFSFNSPYGACPACHGFGNIITIDPSLVIPDENKSLKEGAVVVWNSQMGKKFYKKMERSAFLYNIPLDIPYKALTDIHKEIIWRGKGQFPGVEGFFDLVEKKKYKLHIRVFLSKFRGYRLCSKCNGKRLKPEALMVKIKDKDIGEFTSFNIKESINFLNSLEKDLTEYEYSIAQIVLTEIKKRLEYLINVGLDYLTLDRLTKTLSSGEFQRIKLASSLGSGLTNTLYVLDEPSIGLHARDSERLLSILKRLRDLKNTVLVVEHDPDIIKESDYVVDLGPGPGESGGSIVFEGSPADLIKGSSITSVYLRGEKNFIFHKERDLFSEINSSYNKYITLTGAEEHNLKNITIEIPLNQLVCITGVSGSGKSTFINDILFPAIKREKGDFSLSAGKYSSIKGTEHIEDVIMVDQSPIGKSSRSNPVTYIKAFDSIRQIFSELPMARVKEMKQGDFSFNVPGGRCEHCEGNGYIEIEMQFMADIFVTCGECRGKRYQKRILDITYKGKSIADVLSMTVDEGISFFASSNTIIKKLYSLQETGLGYIKLGQPANTLSGGEAQRLKLASHLLKAKEVGTLYIFDEPTTGLHLADIEKLLLCIRKLIDRGNSVLIIEHNMEVIKNADYIIDLGPEGGDRGGEIIAEGPVKDIINEENSYTGKFLKKYMSL